MRFLSQFLVNLGVLLGGAVVLLILFPDIMSQVYSLLGGILGPVLFLVVIVGALPARRRC